CAALSGGAEYATWKPLPDGAAPSAWMDTTASAPASSPARPRSSTQGPTPSSSVRVSTTRTPRVVRRCATRCATSNVKACSAYPASVEVPVVLQAFVPPRPSGTWRLIAAGEPALPPLWPGSRTTTRARADVASAETVVDGLGDTAAALFGPATV